MGVAGSGKTTIGKALASELGWPFVDGDDHHPTANREKMARGEPLTDTDRFPWLDQLSDLITANLSQGKSLVVACSALKKNYRQRLGDGDQRVRFVHLQGPFDLIEARLVARKDHFMKPGMLESQFAVLEAPADAVIVDIRKEVSQILTELVENLKLA